MLGSCQTTRSITKIYEISQQKNKRRNIKTRWWTPFEPYADNTMYKTSLLEGPGRHHRKNRYTSHEMDEFLKKVVILLARHDHPTLRHCAGASKRRVPQVKKRVNNKRTESERQSFYANRTKDFNKTSHSTCTGAPVRTRGLPTIIDYKDTTTFNNSLQDFVN